LHEALLFENETISFRKGIFMPETTIEALPKGPYKVSGTFELQDTTGEQIPSEKKTVFLCRCGGSKTKPFCDGAHRDVEFDDQPKSK
jgi:CDGSH-type Zn-finger protein